MSSPKKPFSRLPTTVTPVNYALTVKPNLGDFTFTGSLTVSLKVNQETSSITLNALDVVIQQDELLCVKVGEKKILVESIVYSVEDERATLHLCSPLSPGEAQLVCNFSGIIGASLRGFYRSKTVDSEGKESYCAVCQFAPTDARRAFPCWDEPALKASFDTTLIVPRNEKIRALSNMSVKSETISEDGQWRIVSFHRTPIMSSYLVCYVVGEFDRIETVSGDGVKVDVFTAPGKSEQGRFALDVAAKALDFYRKYFDIAYPLDKLSLIAYPDLSYGAMENWGLVSYREARLLVSSTSSTTTRQDVALVVCHELAHQWFGNLVTMEWWDDLWLNEGFASFVEYLAVDAIFPEFNIFTQFVCTDFLRALELDGLASSHPIEVPVGHPSEIDEIFDAISYSKGASVIRMLYNYIGDEDFRAGMHTYLSRFSYRNAQTKDLWKALEEASKAPVSTIMSTWTKQKGYPVITVTASSSPHNSMQTVSLSQEKFCLTGRLTDAEKASLWFVPVSIISANSGDKALSNTLMEVRDRNLTLELQAKEWFKLNPGAVGIYRSKYTPDLLAKFIPGIVSQTIGPLDRLNLLDDLFALVQSGQQRSGELFKFMSAFKWGEHNYTVWCALSTILCKFNQLFAGSKVQELYRTFGRGLINGKVGPYVGWDAREDEPYLDTLLRGLIIARLVDFEDRPTIDKCLQLFKEQVSGGKPIPADLRAPVYKAVASQANETTFELLLKLYKRADNQEEKSRLISALGSVKMENLIQKTLQFAISDQVRLQDSVTAMASTAANPTARLAVWQFFQAKKATFSEMHKQSGILFSRTVKSMLHHFSSAQRAEEVEVFFRENHFAASERAVDQAVETIRLNASLLQRDLDDVAKYLV